MAFVLCGTCVVEAVKPKTRKSKPKEHKSETKKVGRPKKQKSDKQLIWID